MILICIITIYLGQSRRKKSTSRYSIKNIYNNRSVVGKKGVRNENSGNNNIVFVNYKNRGVRQEGISYRLIGCPNTKRSNMLYYNKPCVCGSTYHRNTRHRDCPLNCRYIDAIEKKINNT